VKDYERAVLRVQPNEGALDEVPIGDVASGIVAGWDVDVRDDHLDDAPAAPARLVEGRMDEQSVEPGIEPVRITKSGQIPPGSQERGLDRVARELRVPEDEARGSVEPSGRARGERGKGVVIASPCPLDQRPSVHCPSPSIPA
jgi:hypothetical protein